MYQQNFLRAPGAGHPDPPAGRRSFAAECERGEFFVGQQPHRGARRENHDRKPGMLVEHAVAGVEQAVAHDALAPPFHFQPDRFGGGAPPHWAG